jgi:hypothetical protein
MLYCLYGCNYSYVCLCSFLFSGTEINGSEQQTNEVLAVETDTVGDQDTAIVDHQGTSGACDLYQISTQATVSVVTDVHGNLLAPTSSFTRARAYTMNKYFCSVVLILCVLD